MDINKFLDLRPSWGMEPCLYIVLQRFPGNNAHRCGSSGTHLYKDSDQVFGAERAQLTGLLGRMNMYTNFWLPLRGYIFAALRVKRQLVANPQHRTSTDFTGRVYNITKGQHTLVLEREMQFHQELDKRGYRWQKEKRNELFVPGPKGVEELIATLRTIQGEEMYLFDEDSIIEDHTYRGGRERRGAPVILETGERQQPPREGKDQAPTIKIKLSREAIEALRSNDPYKHRLLMSIVKAAMAKEALGKEEAIQVEQDATPSTTHTPAPAPEPPTTGPPKSGPDYLPTNTPPPTGGIPTPAPPQNKETNITSIPDEPRRSRRLMQAAMSARDIELLRRGDKRAQKIAKALAALS